MEHVFTYRAPRAVALAGTLLFAAACTTGIKVGTDGTGGASSSSTTSGSSSSTGGSVSCSTVADCPVNPGASCATVCADGSNPCENACVGGVCVERGCPDGGAGTGGSGAGGSTGIGGAGGGCSGAIVTVDGDGPTRHFDFACQGSYGIAYTNDANGHFGVLAPHSSVTNVYIDGCKTAGADPLLGSLDIVAPLTMAGTTMEGTVKYDDGTDTYGNPTGAMILTVVEDSAGTISGTYSAAVQPTNGNGVTNISGTFKVCHVSDFFPP